MSQFDSVSLAPADPILSLTEAFKADPNPEKVNLSVGVFVDESGTTPILATVKEAEKRLVETNKTKSYLPITGSPNYAKLTQEICFAKADTSRIVTAQTPGGTGALRVAADFIAGNLESKTIWVSNPTWANHKGVFASGGLEIKTYAYFDQPTLSLDYPAFIEAIKQIPAGDIVLLHACCHNPTGADLNAEQWTEVAAIAKEAGWTPLLDFAYQGFGAGINEDAAGVRAMAANGIQMLVAQSFSKNIGLYRERIGALHIVTNGGEEAQRVASQVKIVVRTNYSNPPAHGGAIVETILGDAELRQRWEKEVDAMRDRINDVRVDFVDAMAAAGISRDFNFLKEQNGMFSFTGLTRDQAIELREKHSIYIVDSGRINVAGITKKNIANVVQALKSILN
ncbi:MAG: amino acid aminotransferase [Verrucomicrobiota bacterium]